MEGLRAGRFQWAAEPHKQIEPFPFDVRVEEWREIGEINLIPLYSDVGNLSTPPPEGVKDALEVLGVGFAERTARVARQLLTDKGYDPIDQ